MELEEANAAFIGNMYTCILPKHILENVDPGTWDTDDFNRHPIGTGKYKFVEWKSGQYIELEKNEDYFGTKPSIDRVYVKFGDETTLTASLINGELDVLYGLSASEIETVEAMGGVRVEAYDMLSDDLWRDRLRAGQHFPEQPLDLQRRCNEVSVRSGEVEISSGRGWIYHECVDWILREERQDASSYL